MNARLIVTALALLALPRVLTAQAGVEANAAAVVEATARAGLPEAPVRRTIEQGRARGATDARIHRAALSTHSRLVASRDALRGEGRREPTSVEIVAGGDALLAGARPADLERVRDAAADRSLALSLTLLADIASRGGDPGAAAAAIAARLSDGASDQSLIGWAAAAGVESGSDALRGGAAGNARAGAGIGLGGGTPGAGASVVGRLRGGL